MSAPIRSTCLMILVATGAACGAPAPDSIDYETLCAGGWPEDDCADGCADSDRELVYEAAFRSFAATQVGVSEVELMDFVTLRSVVTDDAEQSSRTELSFTVDIDWARVLVEHEVSRVGGSPDLGAVLDELQSYAWFPEPDWNATLRPLADARQDIVDCEAELGVHFPRTGWCQGWVTQDRGAGEDLSFSFQAPLEGTDLAVLYLSPSMGETSTCNRYQQHID